MVPSTRARLAGEVDGLVCPVRGGTPPVRSRRSVLGGAGALVPVDRSAELGVRASSVLLGSAGFMPVGRSIRDGAIEYLRVCEHMPAVRSREAPSRGGTDNNEGLRGEMLRGEGSERASLMM